MVFVFDNIGLEKVLALGQYRAKQILSLIGCVPGWLRMFEIKSSQQQLVHTGSGPLAQSNALLQAIRRSLSCKWTSLVSPAAADARVLVSVKSNWFVCFWGGLTHFLYLTTADVYSNIANKCNKGSKYKKRRAW